MSVRWVVTTASIAFTLTSVAGAQAPVLPSHLRAADELIKVLHVEKSVNDAIDIMVKSFVQASPELGQFEDLLRAFLTKYMAWDALRGDYAQLYADTFSEDEIKQLMNFYRTPAGQKLIDSLPQIMKKASALGQAKVAGHLDELKAEVSKRAQELQKGKQAP
jgi:uncharacterized protein